MDLTTAFFGLITWFPICIWIVGLVNWMIVGDIDVISGILGISVALILGVVAMRPPIAMLSPIACVTAYATVLTYPVVTMATNRYAMRKMDVEEVEAAYGAIGQMPSNHLAKFKLAKSIYKLGYTGHAVAIADEVMINVPRRLAEEEYRTLQKWKRMGVPPETLKPLTCIDCHTSCPPGWTHCRNCGAQFLLHRVRGQILPGGVAQKVVAIWGGAVILLIGLPLASSFSTVPAIGTSSVLIVAVAGGLFLTFRKDAGRLA
jgi:hypothetical protein